MASLHIERSRSEQSLVQGLEHYPSNLPPWEQRPLLQQVPKLPDDYATWSFVEREAYAVHWPILHSDSLAVNPPSRSTSQTSSRQVSVASRRDKLRQYGHRSRSADPRRTDATVVLESVDSMRSRPPISMAQAPTAATLPAIAGTISSRADDQRGDHVLSGRSPGIANPGQFRRQLVASDDSGAQQSIPWNATTPNSNLAIPALASRHPIGLPPTPMPVGKRSRSTSRVDSTRAPPKASSGRDSHQCNDAGTSIVYGLGLNQSVEEILESSRIQNGVPSGSQHDYHTGHLGRQDEHRRQLSADYVVMDMPSPWSDSSNMSSIESRSTGASSLSPQILTSSSLSFSTRHHSPAFSAFSKFSSRDPHNPDLRPSHHQDDQATGEAHDPSYWPKPNPGLPASRQYLAITPILPPPPTMSHRPHLPPLSTQKDSHNTISHQGQTFASPPMPSALTPSSTKMMTWKSKLRNNLKNLFKGGASSSLRTEREGWREEDLVYMPHPDSIYD